MKTIIVLFTTGVAILGSSIVAVAGRELSYASLQQRNVAPIAYLMAKAAQTAGLLA
jgi:hypothetical protein